MPFYSVGVGNNTQINANHMTNTLAINNNNNNNNIVICKAHKVSSNTESEAPAVARWAALTGYAKRTVLRWCLKVSVVLRENR